MIQKFSTSVGPWGFYLLKIVAVIILLGMNVKAQDAEGLKKYDWYVDFCQMADAQYQEMLHQKYPDLINEVIIEETAIGLHIDRLIYNSEAEFIVLEKRKWDWGGVLCFENGEKLTLIEYVARYNELTDSKH